MKKIWPELDCTNFISSLQESQNLIRNKVLGQLNRTEIIHNKMENPDEDLYRIEILSRRAEQFAFYGAAIGMTKNLLQLCISEGYVDEYQLILADSYRRKAESQKEPLDYAYLEQPFPLNKVFDFKIGMMDIFQNAAVIHQYHMYDIEIQSPLLLSDHIACLQNTPYLLTLGHEEIPSEKIEILKHKAVHETGKEIFSNIYQHKDNRDRQTCHDHELNVLGLFLTNHPFENFEEQVFDPQNGYSRSFAMWSKEYFANAGLKIIKP